MFGTTDWITIPYVGEHDDPHVVEVLILLQVSLYLLRVDLIHHDVQQDVLPFHRDVLSVFGCG